MQRRSLLALFFIITTLPNFIAMGMEGDEEGTSGSNDHEYTTAQNGFNESHDATSRTPFSHYTNRDSFLSDQANYMPRAQTVHNNHYKIFNRDELLSKADWGAVAHYGAKKFYVGSMDILAQVVPGLVATAFIYGYKHFYPDDREKALEQLEALAQGANQCLTNIQLSDQFARNANDPYLIQELKEIKEATKRALLRNMRLRLDCVDRLHTSEEKRVTKWRQRQLAEKLAAEQRIEQEKHEALLSQVEQIAHEQRQLFDETSSNNNASPLPQEPVNIINHEDELDSLPLPKALSAEELDEIFERATENTESSQNS